MDEETPVNTWTPARRSLQEQARAAVVWIAILALGVGVVMLLVALNQIVNVWFRYQYVPFARLAMALAVIGGAIAVMWRLMAPRR